MIGYIIYWWIKVVGLISLRESNSLNIKYIISVKSPPRMSTTGIVISLLTVTYLISLLSVF